MASVPNIEKTRAAQASKIHQNFSSEQYMRILTNINNWEKALKILEIPSGMKLIKFNFNFIDIDSNIGFAFESEWELDKDFDYEMYGIEREISRLIIIGPTFNTNSRILSANRKLGPTQVDESNEIEYGYEVAKKLLFQTGYDRQTMQILFMMAPGKIENTSYVTREIWVTKMGFNMIQYHGADKESRIFGQLIVHGKPRQLTYLQVKLLDYTVIKAWQLLVSKKDIGKI